MENQPENQLKKLNILYVEDNWNGINPIGRGLKQFGYNVKRVYNGLEAVTYCRENPDIDLVLMDIHMPIMDGIEATREIRTFNKELVIIAMAPVGMFSRKELMEYGCNDFIEKPFTFELLTSVLKKYEQL